MTKHEIERLHELVGAIVQANYEQADAFSVDGETDLDECDAEELRENCEAAGEDLIEYVEGLVGAPRKPPLLQRIRRAFGLGPSYAALDLFNCAEGERLDELLERFAGAAEDRNHYAELLDDSEDFHEEDPILQAYSKADFALDDARDAVKEFVRDAVNRRAR